MSTLHRSGQGRRGNFGVGARLATLARNPAGVFWASLRDHRSAEILVTETANGYALHPWPYEDGTGGSYTRPPHDDILPPMVTEAGHGTSVVMVGHTKGSQTGSDATISALATYLSSRYWSFPDKVTVTSRTSANKRQVHPFGENVMRDAVARGAITVDGDLPALIEWYLLTPSAERTATTSGVRSRSTLAARFQSELFEPSDVSRYWAAFGIPMKSVRDRLVIIVEPIDGVEMDTARTHLVRGRGRSVPWTEWGRMFADQMPAEIAALMETSVPKSNINAGMLAKLPDWFRKVALTASFRAAKDGTVQKRIIDDFLLPSDAGGNDTDGEDTDEDDNDPDPTPGPIAGKPDDRSIDEGDKPSKEFNLPNPPTVVRVPEKEWTDAPYWVRYVRSSNELLVLQGGPIMYVEVESRVVATGLPKAVIEEAVFSAYSDELAMKVLHLLCLDEIRTAGVKAYQWTAHQIEKALTPAVLSASITGMNAVGPNIDAAIRDLLNSDGVA